MTFLLPLPIRRSFKTYSRMLVFRSMASMSANDGVDSARYHGRCGDR